MKENMCLSSLVITPELNFQKRNQFFVNQQLINQRKVLGNLLDLTNLSITSNKNNFQKSVEQINLETSRSEWLSQCRDLLKDSVNSISKSPIHIKSIDAKDFMSSRRFSDRTPFPSCFLKQNQIPFEKQENQQINQESKPSETEKYLMKKIEQATKKLVVLQSEYPCLIKENRTLKQQGKSLKTRSVIQQQKLNWWQKHSTQKDIEAIKKINNNYKAQLKIVNQRIGTSRISSKSMIVK